MGMDLKPIKPTKKAPRHEDGSPEWGRYNWHGWSKLAERLKDWGRPDLIEYMAGYNDGVVIPAKICREIGKLIAHNRYTYEDPEYA